MIKVDYLSKYDILRIQNKKWSVGLWYRFDRDKILQRFKKVGILVSMEPVDYNTKDFVDFFLYEVGPRLREDQVFISYPGKYGPFRDILVEYEYEKDKGVIVKLQLDGITVVAPRLHKKYQVTDGEVIVGDGRSLVYVENLTDFKMAIVFDHIEDFSKETGISEMERKERVSFSPKKIRDSEEFVVVAL